ncbi:unnamed protein product [Owenia fusiformis]|uniref:Uncharacterized protein n=1 Tax=Owenia fusiformis TaxID=6347 RepID=A0A8J1YBJ5_OWEFU|nr:unnamed protein product [Owenia fusiformis]
MGKDCCEIMNGGGSFRGVISRNHTIRKETASHGCKVVGKMSTVKQLFQVFLVLNLCLTYAGGWGIISGTCVASCAAVAGIGGVTGTALLAYLGFTASGIAAGSWAAGWMAGYAGAVPAGGWFAALQSAGAIGSVSGAATTIWGTCSGICAAIGLVPGV